MTRVFQYSRTFQKLFDGLPDERKKLVLKCLEVLKTVPGGKAPQHGLMIKRLYAKGEGFLFEARAGMDIRVVWCQTQDQFRLLLVGNHDEVRKFIKKF